LATLVVSQLAVVLDTFARRPRLFPLPCKGCENAGVARR